MSQLRGRWSVKGGKSSVRECLQVLPPHSPPPQSPLVFFFLREFYSRALLSERLEQAMTNLKVSAHIFLAHFSFLCRC